MSSVEDFGSHDSLGNLGNLDTEQQRLIQEFQTNLTSPIHSGGHGVGVEPTVVASYRRIPDSWLDNLTAQPKPVPPASETCLAVLRPEIAERFNNKKS